MRRASLFSSRSQAKSTSTPVVHKDTSADRYHSVVLSASVQASAKSVELEFPHNEQLMGVAGFVIALVDLPVSLYEHCSSLQADMYCSLLIMRQSAMTAA